MVNKIMAQDAHKETEMYCKTTTHNAVIYTNHADAQCMARVVQDVVELICPEKIVIFPT